MSVVSNYVRQLASIHLRLVARPVQLLEQRVGGATACRIRNCKLRLKGHTHRFAHDRASNLYRVTDGEHAHWFADRERGFALYADGLDSRRDELCRSYLLDRVEFRPSDVVVDCGANYADLALVLNGRIAPHNYITFEPGAQEFGAIRQNAPAGVNNNVGLGNRNETRRFYVNNRFADSSVIEPASYHDVVDVETVTLSSYVRDHGLSDIRLLKLEAEGFEPEILDGAADVLGSIDYVAIDGGHERGVNQDETFSDQTNRLAGAGFEMVGVNLEWGRALFRNTRRT